jgi:hypothetical protein
MLDPRMMQLSQLNGQILWQHYLTIATCRQFAALAAVKAPYSTGLNAAMKPVFAHPLTTAAASAIYTIMKCTF